MVVLLAWILGVGVFAALFIYVATASSRRAGRTPETFLSRRRAARAARAAVRPVATASERFDDETRFTRLTRPVVDLVTGRRRVRRDEAPAEAAADEEAAATPAARRSRRGRRGRAEAAPAPARSAADRADRPHGPEQVERVEEPAAPDGASERPAAAEALPGSPERGDEVAARRRAAQERILAKSANRMATRVPGRIEETDVDDLDLLDVDTLADLPRASGNGH